MKKNYRLLSLLFVIPLFLSGCQGRPGGGGSSGDQSQASGVTGVAIDKVDETTVLDGTRVSLKAKVSGDEGVSQKVKWSSSDDSVATVTNGVVNFLKVSEEKKVTITAAAQEDANFKDSVEFTVEHSPFDLKNSRGNPDTSLFFDDGSFIIEDPQDIALIYSDVHDTRWYVEATIIINDADPTDAYPKFGIMASERDDGFWTHEKSHQIFYYVDSVRDGNTWSNMNVVKENDTLDNWDWAGQLSPTTASPSVKRGEAFKMGLMRDGSNFYQFYGKASDLSLKMVGSFEYNSFGDQANYVWVGGWKEAAVISDAKCMVGDEIDALYTIPEGLSLKSNEEILYLGETYRIQVTTEGLWDRNKLTFTSSDPTIATVDEKGVITASSEKAGNVTITVGLQGTELSAEFALEVTDDEKFRVILDGEMNDLIWSDKVKTNRYLLKKNDSYYVNIYGAKNSRGLYLFMDYVVAEQAICNPNEWWTWENVEFRLADDDKAWSGQYWLSSMNGGSFVSVGTGEKPEAIFYKALVKGEDNLYHGAFEMFVPYGDDCVTKGESTYACFGFAPKSGWYNGYNWYANPIPETTLNITEDGFAHDGTQCSEGHVYGDWVVDLAPTCQAAGSRHKDCAFCGHRVTEVLPIDPDAHQFDYEHAVVTTPATCSTTGIGTATCTLCGAIDETVLPLDFTNHSDTDYPTTHGYCHGCNVGDHLTNASGDAYDHNFGGWDNKTTWTDLGVIRGNFKVELEFNMKGCLGGNPSDPGSTCWRTVLPVLYDEGFDAGTHKVDVVFRMDWFGWSDGGYATEQDKGSMPAGFDWNVNSEAFSDMDITLVITKNGAKVTLDWVWECNATTGMYVGKTFEYHQSCTLANGEKTGVALSAEWTTYTVTKAQVTRL